VQRSTGARMKRSPLKRTGGLKRTGRLKPVSDKRRKLQAETSPIRRALVEFVGVCEVCERNAASDVHEVTAGRYRAKAVKEWRTWIVLCRECHDAIQGEKPEAGHQRIVGIVTAAMRRVMGRNLNG